jgi:AcrR family transcriptional regulator
MRNPEATRNIILKKSGVLFNTQGYQATSISDITSATGFTKGAIYRHFVNKDELEMEALRHLSTIMFDNFRKRIVAQKTAGEKLRAIFNFFESYITDPPIKGGCPLLNSAIESDDANPALRKASLDMLAVFRETLENILAKGVKYKQIKAGIDKGMFATLVIAGLEGAIMMSKLEGNNTDIRRMLKMLDKQLSEIEL